MSVSFTAGRAEIAERKNGFAPGALRDLGGRSFLALCGLAAGLIIAALPLQWSAAIIGGGVLLAAAFLEPLAGLAIMLLLGPTEPLLAAAGLMPVSIGQATFALFAAGWLLRGLAHRQIRWPRLPITIYFFLYLFAAALSASVSHPASPKDSATELLKWVEMLAIAGIVYDAAGRKKLGWVIAILFAAGLFQAGVGFWQFQFRGHGPEAFKILGDHYRAYGTLEQPNPFGGFMGIVWPIAGAFALHAGFGLLGWSRGSRMARIRRIDADDSLNQIRENPLDPRYPRATFLFATTTAAAALGALVLSFSRGAWLGAAAAGLAMLVFWPRRRWLGLALAGGSLIAFLILYNLGLLPSFIASRFADVGDFVQVYDVRGVHVNDSNFSIVERLAHWQAAMSMADARPLTGVGFGNYEAAYPDYRLVKWQYALGHAHMIYLNVLAETGVVGLAAYLILWGAIIVVTIRVISRKDSSGFGNPKGLDRALAVGLLGCWVHLAAHQLLDNLYVGNIPLYLGALLGVLSIIAQPQTPKLETPCSNSRP